MDPHLTRDPVDNLMSGTVPGMAHFAGTGPKGKVCGVCAFYKVEGSEAMPLHMRCDKYEQLVGKEGPRNIPFHTRSCRYFVQAKKNAEK